MRTSIFALGLFSALLTQTVSAEKINMPKPAISVQLHSVKTEIDGDFKNTLIEIAKMGFEGVEFAGRYGPYKESPAKLKIFLDALGLKVNGAHIPMHALRDKQLYTTINFFKQLGTDTLIIPHDARVDNPKKIAELAAELTDLSELLNKMGMRLGYHNHAKEFKPYQTSTFWDYLASHTPQSVILQLDAGWANFANVDPIEYVKKYPSRTYTTHYKIRTKPEQSTSVILGEDSYPWAELIKANMEFGATKWIVIEQEEYPKGKTALEAVNASMISLQKIINSI